MQTKLAIAALAAVLVATASSPSFAATEAQVRAKCAKLAQTNASASSQQRYADVCVQKALANQKK